MCSHSVKMLLSSLILSLLAISSAIPSQHHPCNPTKLEQLKEEIGVNSTTTISDVVSFFDTTLSQSLIDEDFFQGSTLSPATHWPLQKIDCYDNQGKTELILSAAYHFPLEIIPMFMTITRARVQMRLVAVQGDVLNTKSIPKLTIHGYSMHGLWTVSDVSVALTLRKGLQSAIHMSGSTRSQTVLLESFIQSLGGRDVFSQNIQSLAFPVSNQNFLLRNTTLRGVYSPSHGYSISFYGHPVFTGAGPHRLSILLQRSAGSESTIFALTAVYSSISLSQLILQLSGTDISSIPVIGSALPEETGVMIATEDIHDVFIFRGDENDDPQRLFNGRLIKGVSLVVGFNDSILGNGSRHVIQLAPNKVTFTTVTHVGITTRDLFEILVPRCDVDLLFLPQDVPNVFASTYSSFVIDTKKEMVSVNIGLDDTYHNAFGINWMTLVFDRGVISLSDKHLFSAASHIKLHAAVYIGSKAGKKLSGHATLAISSTKPTLTTVHFNSSITAVALQDLVHAFDLSVTLSGPLASASFFQGLVYTFSVMYDGVFSHILVPNGTALQGTMNIIGLELPASVAELDSSNGLIIDLTMVPVSLDGGLFQLYRVENEEMVGPQFRCAVRKNPPSVSLSMDGQASLLGVISQPAVLQITDTEYVVDIVAPFFSFDAHLRFYAPYGSLSLVTFQVYGKLLADWKAAITERVVELIVTSAKNATTANVSASSQACAVSRAQTSLDTAVRDLVTKHRNYAKTKEAYSRAVSALGVAKQKQEKACSSVPSGSCDLVCVFCRKWTCCGRLSLPWGSCVKCLRPNSCCHKRLSPKCNSLCAVAIQEVQSRQQDANRTLDELNDGRHLVRLAKNLVNAKNMTLYQSKESLKQAKTAVSRVGIAAASAIARVGKSALFTVRKIDFDVPIALAARGRFSGMVEAAILENDYQAFVFDLRLENLEEMARDLAEMIFPGITGGGQ